MYAVDRYRGTDQNSQQAGQVEREAMLGELAAARIALGAALAANASATVKGLAAPCDADAIMILTAEVLDAFRAVQDSDLDAVLTVEDVMSFCFEEEDGGVRLHAAVTRVAERSLVMAPSHDEHRSDLSMAVSGHDRLAAVETPRGFIAYCECGWHSEGSAPQTNAQVVARWAEHTATTASTSARAASNTHRRGEHGPERE